MSEVVVDVSGDIEDFRRFLMLRLFRLVLYTMFRGNRMVYCVGLLVRCVEPEGWFSVWSRCYDGLEEARELFNGVEMLARNRLGDLLLVEVRPGGSVDQEVVSD
jgi:hypothetical protein